MNKILATILALAFCCMPALAASPEEIAGKIIPRPASVTEQKGSFRISGAAMRCDSGFDATSVDFLRRFASRVSLASGKSCPFSTPAGLQNTVKDGSVKGVIFLKDSSLAVEEYEIDIDSRHCIVRASGHGGLVNAVATLMQMLPEEVYTSGNGSTRKWVLDGCIIKDKAAREERAIVADCAGKFRTADELESIIREAAKYKINTLYLILSSEDRWRVKSSHSSPLAQVSIYYDNGNEAGVYLPEELAALRKSAERMGTSIVPVLVRPGRILEYLDSDDIHDSVKAELAMLFGHEIIYAEPELCRQDIGDKDIRELAASLWSD